MEIKVRQLTTKCQLLDFEKTAYEKANFELWNSFIDSELLESLIFKLNEVLETPITFANNIPIYSEFNNSIISSFSLK